MNISDYYVDDVEFRCEMFDYYDQIIVANVGRDNYPVGNEPYGKFTTGILRMASFSRPRIIYQRSSWRNEEGYILINEELVRILDQALRDHLNIHLNADLYNCLNIELASAKVVKWTRCKKLIRLLRNLW